MSTRAPPESLDASAEPERTPSRESRRAQRGQPLKIAAPDSADEREAEQAARQAMAGGGRGARAAGGRRTPVALARATSAHPVEAAIGGRLGRGSPLPADVAESMGARFGADFGSVRIHTDASAAALSDQVAARAFTFGRDLFFNAGEYQPGTRDGQALLAHELAHTLQRGEGIRREKISKAESLRIFATINGPFVYHYYYGKGESRELKELGGSLIVKLFENHPSVQRQVDWFISNTFLDRTFGDFKCEDVDVTNTIYAIGAASLFMKAVRVKSGYSFAFWINDRFDNPLNLGLEVGGTPYLIKHLWTIQHLKAPRVPAPTMSSLSATPTSRLAVRPGK